MSVLAAAPAQAERSERALPERFIDEKNPNDYQISFDTFKLKGKVLEPQADGTYLPYAKQKVQLQKKKCPRASCKWKWRVKVKGSDGYKTTKGNAWTTAFE